MVFLFKTILVILDIIKEVSLMRILVSVIKLVRKQTFKFTDFLHLILPFTACNIFVKNIVFFVIGLQKLQFIL